MWILNVAFEFDTESEAIDMRDAIAIIEPNGLSVCSIVETVDQPPSSEKASK